MIKGQNIVCISNTTWYGPITKSTVQIMSRLAEGNRILFVEYPFTVKDVIYGLLKKGNAPVSRILGFKPRISPIHTPEGTVVQQLIVPAVLPCDFIKNEFLFNLIFGINSWIYKRSVQKAIRKLKMTDIVSVSAYNPCFGLSLKGKLKEILNVYYSYDGPNLRRHGKRVLVKDAAYAKVTNAVITTSDFLASEKRKHNPNCFVVKNGVDFNEFSRFAKTDNFRDNQTRIGYIGSMDFRFDINMVEEAVKSLPEYSFHFIGHIRNEAIRERLSEYANVTFFKPVKPSEVPALLSGFHAGIIPYLQNEINRNIYPLKINEYLAAGVPVVMSRFSELPEFEGEVDSVKTAAEFIRCLKKQVTEDSPEKRKTRIAFAKGNSWDIRAEEFSAVLEHLLNEK